MSTPKKTEDELRTLAQAINADHAAIVERERGMASRAMAAGEKLMELKAAVGHGAWEEALRNKCPGISPETARVYMKLAKNKDTILKQQRATDLSIREALALLRPAKAKKRKKKKKVDLSGSPDLATALECAAPDEVMKALRDAEWEPQALREVARGIAPEIEGEELKGRSATQMLAALKAVWTRERLRELTELLRAELGPQGPTQPLPQGKAPTPHALSAV
jgi:hypothetical protein